MKKIIKSISIVAIFFGLASFTNSDSPLPVGWFQAGSNHDGYEMSLDRSIFKTGSSSARISSKDKKTKGFGTLMQTCSAEAYLGKKIRLSGYVKTQDVKKWSGLWARIDGINGKVLSFDNMKNRAIKKTTDWTKYEIDINVPNHASSLNFGALVVGNGTLWFDDLTIEVLHDLPGLPEIKELSPAQNLGFDE